MLNRMECSSSDKCSCLTQPQIPRCVVLEFSFFSACINMSNPREIVKEIDRQKKLKIERIKKLENVEIKKLKQLKKSKKNSKINLETQEQEKEKETIANLTNKLSIILKEILLQTFLENAKQLTKQAKENKVPKKCIRPIDTFKDVMIKKEKDEKVDAYEKRLRSKYIELIN